MTATHVLTIVAVADVQRAAAFYRAAFGWQTVVEVPPYVEFAMPDGRRFGVYKREGFALNTGATPVACPFGATTATEIYFHCDDLDAAIARIGAAGGRLLSACAARDWGDEAAYFADLDGNVIVLARPIPR
ncbi:MAG: VOC family protein [Deltaproteobacteria bacterium]|nr:VOC family protein [Deltaproteobacteria bacterium]